MEAELKTLAGVGAQREGLEAVDGRAEVRPLLQRRPRRSAVEGDLHGGRLVAAPGLQDGLEAELDGLAGARQGDEGRHERRVVRLVSVAEGVHHGGRAAAARPVLLAEGGVQTPVDRAGEVVGGRPPAGGHGGIEVLKQQRSRARLRGAQRHAQPGEQAGKPPHAGRTITMSIYHSIRPLFEESRDAGSISPDTNAMGVYGASTWKLPPSPVRMNVRSAALPRTRQ